MPIGPAEPGGGAEDPSEERGAGVCGANGKELERECGGDPQAPSGKRGDESVRAEKGKSQKSAEDVRVGKRSERADDMAIGRFDVENPVENPAAAVVNPESGAGADLLAEAVFSKEAQAQRALMKILGDRNPRLDKAGEKDGA